MPTQGFSHYNLRASREMVDRLCRFYCDVVGLSVGDRPPFDFHGYWLYAGGQAILHLAETSPGEHRLAERVSTFDHAAFSCTELAAFERKLHAQGVKYRKAQVPQRRQVQLFLSDPAGNGVELNFEGQDA